MKVTILGAGAFGLALSRPLINNKNDLTIWTPIEQEKEMLLKDKKSDKLKGYVLEDGIKVTTDLKEAIVGSKLIVIAIPTQFISNTCKEIKKYIEKDQYICIASKGIENDTCLFAHEIVKKYLKTKNIGVISGPSFAVDLNNEVPIGLSAASISKRTLNIIDKAFCNDKFKLYPTDDILGIEICGAIKNTIAIASGMIDGMGYPISTQAMLITESLHDIKNLIKALGGNKNSILSFAGFGDILLTCTSPQSRNYTYGAMLGKRISKEELEEFKKTNTVEGLYTLKSINKLINKRKIDIPLITIIYDIAFNDANVEKLTDYLMS